MIFIKTTSSDFVKYFPLKTRNGIILRQLKKNRRKLDGKFVSHISSPMVIVRSVFFIKNLRVIKVWDAKINGFRSVKNKYFDRDLLRKIRNDN